MNHKKDISDLIKANAHKLEERPAKEAWERLEDRLDQNIKRRSLSIRRSLSLAASVIGLVGVTALITLSFQKGEQNITADKAIRTESFEIEAIEQRTEEEKGFYKVVEFQKKYQDRLANPTFEEGTRKKFTVAKVANRPNASH